MVAVWTLSRRVLFFGAAPLLAGRIITAATLTPSVTAEPTVAGWRTVEEGIADMSTTHYPRRLILTLLAGVISIFAANFPAAADTQRQFASPEDAMRALRTAVEAKDEGALAEIFGPEFHSLHTGDATQDANNREHFAEELAQGCNPVKEQDDKIFLEVGTNNWPMPIPLVKVDGQWHFDTAAGKEEIVNRHIGQDELCAIGVCRAYVKAQQQFAGMNSTGQPEYAQKFKSSPEKRDGLYWPANGTGPESPFGPLVAEAHAEGYVSHPGGGLHPFHGYYFRVLTRQGNAATGGKMNYIRDGKMTGGFALVAYPEHWDRSGIMTFIVNQDATVYERNLGEKSTRIAGKIKEFNPESGWSPARDEGILDAATEKLETDSAGK
jgi:hypothetical protein